MKTWLRLRYKEGTQFNALSPRLFYFYCIACGADMSFTYREYQKEYL